MRFSKCSQKPWRGSKHRRKWCRCRHGPICCIDSQLKQGLRLMSQASLDQELVLPINHPLVLPISSDERLDDAPKPMGMPNRHTLVRIDCGSNRTKHMQQRIGSVLRSGQQTSMATVMPTAGEQCFDKDEIEALLMGDDDANAALVHSSRFVQDTHNATSMSRTPAQTQPLGSCQTCARRSFVHGPCPKCAGSASAIAYPHSVLHTRMRSLR